MSDTRIVLVTGAAGAIGAATAKAFMTEGWHVVGLDRRSPDGADSCSEFIVDDVADDELPARLLQHASLADRLDALVNNAAIQIEQPLVETADETWRQVMSTNVDAAFRLIRTFHSHLAASRGAIVNVSSVHALATSPNVAAYAVSKAALAGLTRTAALELALHGIRCNAVLPGAVMSDMLRAGLSRREHPEGPQGNLDALIARTPLGFVATPEQIAPSIVFLADGERSPYTTGQLLVVDGGAMIRLGTE
jgi:NAD(P)-dependent dehydrogenase (short-subunit alcohol dehydrogenase family)